MAEPTFFGNITKMPTRPLMLVTTDLPPEFIRFEQSQKSEML